MNFTIFPDTVAQINSTMNSTLSSNASTAVTATPNIVEDPKTSVGIHIVFGMLASVAIIGNLLVCLVSIHQRAVMKGALHTLIFCLAIIDMLTGLFAIITPGFVIPAEAFPYPNGTAGVLYCKLIDSEYFLFSLGFISIYLVLTITLERWFAIAQPWRYKVLFSVKNCRIMVACIIIGQLILTIENILNETFNPAFIPPCQWGSVFDDKATRNIFFIIMETIRLFIPVTVIVLCYIDIARRLFFLTKIGQNDNVNKSITRRRATITAFTASMALIVCWLPNELYFTLFQFEVIQLDPNISKAFKILIITNSSLNPFLYAITNELYRDGIIKLFSSLKSRKHGKRNKPRATQVFK
ncbi:Histamine H2 receptor [Trichoplax sp. H2]|nr:Histamine H2 receptor [Trichoplax sp. H2]|eukprot:RDD42902.1 Histamine H2 receptor [Trichoplax sp. H2]